MKHVSLLLLLLPLLYDEPVAQANAIHTNYRKLQADVFDPYVSALPHCFADSPVLVTLSFSLYMIVEVIERENVLEVSGWYDMEWFDCQLKWHPKNYANITQSQFPDISHLWLPDITWWEKLPATSAIEFTNGMFEGSRAMISSGFVRVTRQTFIKTHCPMNLQLFPFDSQSCNISFMSWTYNTTNMLLLTKQTAADLYQYRDTGMWVVNSVPATKTNETDGNVKYSKVVYEVKMSREPWFYFFYLMLPGFLMSFVGCFVFLLPPAAQEKNAFSLSVLVSLCVFMNVMVNHTPPESEIPLLSIYFFVVLLISTLEAAMGVVIQCVYLTDQSYPVPNWLTVLLIRPLTKTCSQYFQLSPENAENYCTAPEYTDHHSTVLEHTVRLNLQRIRGLAANLSPDTTTTTTTTDGDTKKINHWWQVAFVLDRLFFLLDMTCTIVALLVFVIVGLNNRSNNQLNPV